MGNQLAHLEIIGIGFATVLAVLAALWLVSAAIVGYCRRPLAVYMRVAFATAGFLLLIPASMFAGAGWTDLIGIALGLMIVGRELMVPKVQPAAQ